MRFLSAVVLACITTLSNATGPDGVLSFSLDPASIPADPLAPKPKGEGNRVPIAEAKFMAKPPVIDGKLDPGEWDTAFKITPFLDRFTKKLPKDTTEAWLGYDKTNIYVGWYCHDTEPGKIVGREIIPNSRFSGEDTVTLSINTFGTRSFSQISEFISNVLGTQTESIAGGRAGKREWRGAWLSKTSRVEDGWICEMAIPWTILNYPNQKKVNMDLNLIRRQGRTLFEQSWANVTPAPLPELQGIWRGIEPPPPPKPKAQYLAYAVAEVEDDKPGARYGFDARYPFTGSFNGVLSVTPDFRNIEDVIAGIDFVRIERFLNETRPFFNEGGGFFRLGNNNAIGSMFYSRRIGPFDVGTKAYGQLTPTLGVGALYATQFDGQQSMVVNAVKTIDATTKASFYATSDQNNGRNNTAAGVNFVTRNGSLGFEMDAVTESDSGQKPDTAGTLSVNYVRPDVNGTLRYLWVDPQFNPALAFIPWTDRRGIYGRLEHFKEWRKGPIRSYRVFSNLNQFRTFDGVLQEGGYDIGARMETRNDLFLRVNRSRYTYSGSLDETTTYNLGINVTNRFKQLNLGYTEGIQGDLPSRFISIGASYRPIDNLDLGLSQSILDREDTQRQTILTMAYQLSNDQLLAARIAQTSAGTNAYLSYRKAGLAGTEYYLILGDPNALTTQRRISAKVVWAF